MNDADIVSVLKDLNKVTGFRISLHDKEFREIAAYPEERTDFCAHLQSFPEEYERCRECDRKFCLAAKDARRAMIYKCRYGLTEAISPLYNFGILSGYLMMGQVIDSEEQRARSAELIEHLCKGADEAKAICSKIPISKKDMTDAYVRIMTLLASYLTLSNALPAKKLSLAEATKKYISENFKKKISIQDMCREFGCSKSSLLSSFKREFGKTPGEFILSLRLDEACALLTKGELSINEIAHETGFYDQSYFTKVFRKSYGIPPSEYKRGEFQSHT